MGYKFMDNFSLLHLAVGIVFYYWGISLKTSTTVHVIFELLENTEPIMKITNSTGWWPGGKPSSDNYLNMFGDTVFFMLGWILAYYLDEPNNERGKYN